MKKDLLKIFTIIMIIITAIIYITGKLNMDKKIQAYKYAANDFSLSNYKGPYEKLKNSNAVNVLVLSDEKLNNGNNNVFDETASYLKAKYNSTVSVDKNIVNGNTLLKALMDFDINKYEKKYDLVILNFGTYDVKQYDENVFYGLYDSLIRKIYTLNPDSDIIIIKPYNIDSKYSSKIDKLNKDYNLSLVDTNRSFSESAIEINNLIDNNIITEQGLKILANAIEKAVQSNVESNKKVLALNDINSDQNEFSNYTYIATFNEYNGYTKSSVGNDTFYKSNNVGDVLSANINGRYFAISYLSGPDCGEMDVYIDHQYIKTIDAFNESYVLKYDFIKGGLSERVHRVAIQLSSVKNDKSTGYNVYIKNYIVFGK